LLPATCCCGLCLLQGSGLSDGKWVTLGAHEVEDLGVVVQHLREQGGVSSVGLWGRSMGAVTALLYSHTDHNIAGMVGFASWGCESAAAVDGGGGDSARVFCSVLSCETQLAMRQELCVFAVGVVLQVLDSPFSRLTDLMLEIVVSQKLPIPKVWLCTACLLAVLQQRWLLQKLLGCWHVSHV
jgi:pimeloyl-ACP methyl ester carboxylesterase